MMTVRLFFYLFSKENALQLWQTLLILDLLIEKYKG